MNFTIFLFILQRAQILSAVRPDSVVDVDLQSFCHQRIKS